MAKSIRPTIRDRLILEHIHQFGLSTPIVLKDEFFENKKMAAAESTIRRLRKHGLVSSHQIPSSRCVYYRLTPAGGKLVGVEANEKEYKFHKLGSSIGMLYFICCNSPSVKRVRCSEKMLRRLISDNVQRFPRIDFYMGETKQDGAQDSTTSLGFAIVDLKSLHQRIVYRCVSHSRKFIQRGWFSEVMKAGRFEITVLTGNESKRDDLLLSVPRELRRQLRRDIFKNGLSSPSQFPINFNVEVIPELDEIVPFKKKNRSGSTKRISRKAKRR